MRTRAGSTVARGSRGLAATLALVTAGCVGVGAPPAPGGGHGPRTTTVVFDEPGVHEWRVPSGVRYATFDVYGAGGGTGASGAGGVGAHVTVTLAVRRGTVLTVSVGGKGADAGGQIAPAPGGFGGGAAGGAGSAGLDLPESAPFDLPGGPAGGGGGGASDVRTGAGELADRILVAGGGGGGGAVSGGASGLTGQSGANGQFTSSIPDIPPSVVFGGGGATATAGGAAGSGGTGGQPSAGALGLGGAGGDAPPTNLEDVLGRLILRYSGHGGGGGGGGLYGGGGGAAAGSSDGPSPLLSSRGSSSGGGGGSSLVPAGTPCPATVEAAPTVGDGSVTITYRRGTRRPPPCE